MTLSGVLIYATAANIVRMEKMSAKENVSSGNRRDLRSIVWHSLVGFFTKGDYFMFSLVRKHP